MQITGLMSYTLSATQVGEYYKVNNLQNLLFIHHNYQQHVLSEENSFSPYLLPKHIQMNFFFIFFIAKSA